MKTEVLLMLGDALQVVRKAPRRNRVVRTFLDWRGQTLRCTVTITYRSFVGDDRREYLRIEGFPEDRGFLIIEHIRRKDLPNRQSAMLPFGRRRKLRAGEMRLMRNILKIARQHVKQWR